MRARNRQHDIMIQRAGAPVDDGYNTVPGAFADYAKARANIVWGSGREQREAAQENASQTASFEVPRTDKTRTTKVTDRICYPITDPDPSKWPAWDIQAVAELGLNEGVRITATKAAD